MGEISASRDPKRLIRSKKLFGANKLKKCVSSSKYVKPKVVLLEISELDDSFKTCAYPNMVEILKLSEQLNLPPSTIKSEFKKRREVFRQRNHLDEDEVIYNSTLPRIILFLNFLCTYFNYVQQTFLKAAIFISSILSVGISACWKNSHKNYNQISCFDLKRNLHDINK